LDVVSSSKSPPTYPVANENKNNAYKILLPKIVMKKQLTVNIEKMMSNIFFALIDCIL